MDRAGVEGGPRRELGPQRAHQAAGARLQLGGDLRLHHRRPRPRGGGLLRPRDLAAVTQGRDPRRLSLDWRLGRVTSGGTQGPRVAEAVTGLELFAFVVLPVAVGASAWGVVLVAERRSNL